MIIADNLASNQLKSYIISSFNSYDIGFDMLSYDIIQKLVFGNSNKVKLLRENQSMTIEELAKAANVTKEYIENLEQNPIEQLTPDLAKIVNVLEIDEELLLTSPLWLDDKDLKLLNAIFNKIPNNENSNHLKKQIINWAGIILHHSRQNWLDFHKETSDIINILHQKKTGQYGAAIRDNKYAPFRKYFKKQQKIMFSKWQQNGKTLSARGFAKWFLENTPKHIEIPYNQQNQFNKLTQLALQNNREFKLATSAHQ